MKTSIQIFGVVLFACSVSLMSCEKYDNGGSKKKADKNIQNTWKIDSYYSDGVDNTANLLISNYTENYSSAGVYTRAYTDASSDPQNDVGNWVFDSDKSLLNISGIGSFELTAATSTVSASDYTLLKLTQDELWYNFSNGGSTHEFHLIPN